MIDPDEEVAREIAEDMGLEDDEIDRVIEDLL